MTNMILNFVCLTVYCIRDCFFMDDHLCLPADMNNGTTDSIRPSHSALGY